MATNSINNSNAAATNPVSGNTASASSSSEVQPVEIPSTIDLLASLGIGETATSEVAPDVSEAPVAEEPDFFGSLTEAISKNPDDPQVQKAIAQQLQEQAEMADRYAQQIQSFEEAAQQQEEPDVNPKTLLAEAGLVEESLGQILKKFDQAKQSPTFPKPLAEQLAKMADKYTDFSRQLAQLRQKQEGKLLEKARDGLSGLVKAVKAELPQAALATAQKKFGTLVNKGAGLVQSQTADAPAKLVQTQKPETHKQTTVAVNEGEEPTEVVEDQAEQLAKQEEKVPTPKREKVNAVLNQVLAFVGKAKAEENKKLDEKGREVFAKAVAGLGSLLEDDGEAAVSEDAGAMYAGAMTACFGSVLDGTKNMAAGIKFLNNPHAEVLGEVKEGVAEGVQHLATSVEKRNEILGAMPGDEKFAENGSKFGKLTGPAKREFKSDLEGTVFGLWANWKPLSERAPQGKLFAGDLRTADLSVV